MSSFQIKKYMLFVKFIETKMIPFNEKKVILK